MAEYWVLTKGLTNCRNRLNLRFPNRDRQSDGSIGDLAHQLEAASGHNPDVTGNAEYRDGDLLNEVRAIDVDKDFRDPQVTAEDWVQLLVVEYGRKRGLLQRYVRYIIYNGRIWRSGTGWKTEAYYGPNTHEEHIHISGAYSQFADEDTAWDWGLNDLGDVMLKDELIPVTESSQPLFPDRATASASEFLALSAIYAYRANQTAARAQVADAARDAQTAALLAQMTTLLQQLSQTSGALTPEQLEILRNNMKDAAAAAGVAATERLEASLTALRQHLGDDAPISVS